MKRILIICVFSSILCSYIYPQRVISGQVTDESGMPLIGANVIIKGTNNGTITDIDGIYSLSVPSNATILVFSYTGYTTSEVVLGETNVLNIVLSEGVLLSEVVKTGYTSEKKQDVISSISSVKAEQFELMPVQSFDRALQGRASGVQIFQASGAPGGAVNINVRGIGSINAGTGPLIIVDGVQLGTLGQTTQGSSNPLNAINPNDIESIEILKDASATAIYGAQGANGIVLVTTKSGARGKKAQISFSAQEGRVEPFNLYEMMNARQYAQIRHDAYVNAGLPASEAILRYGDPNDPNLPTYDWVDVMFRTGKLRQYNISAAGGTDNVSYFAGFGYDFQEGQIIKNNFERFTGRFNLDADITKKLSMNLRISMARTDQFGAIANGNFVNGPFMATFSSMPVSAPINEETGDYNPYPVNGESHLFNYNILQGVNEESRLGYALQSIGNLGMNYKVSKDLTFRTSVGVDYVNNKDRNDRPSTIPIFAAFNGQVTLTNRVAITFNTTNLLEYSKDFGIGQFSALVGHEYYQTDFETFAATGRGFADPYFRNLDQAANPFGVFGTSTTNRREGLFTSIKYNHNRKYYAGATLRREGSSRFGTANRYGIFYSFSLGYRISDDLFANSSFIDEIKIRGSFGTSGNSDLRDNDGNIINFPGAAYSSVGQYLGGAALRPNRLANDLLGWESSIQTNVGIDFSFKDSRFYGAIDLWQKNNKDLLLATQLPASAGIVNLDIIENVGEISNKGIDFEVSSVNYNRGSFKWTTTLNFSVQQNRVKSLNNNLDTIYQGDFPQLIVGQPVNFFYLLDFAGVNPANGRAMVYNSEGVPIYSPTVSDGNVAGSPIPTYYGGFTNTISIGNLSLSGFFQWQGGHQGFNGDMYNLAASGASPNNQLAREVDYWKQPGDLTNSHKPVQGGSIDGVGQTFGFIGTTRYMSEATYLRLKEVRVAYNLRNKFLRDNGVTNINVFVQGLNMMTWTKFDGIDPEVISSNNNNGISSFGVFPLGRQFTAGLKVDF